MRRLFWVAAVLASPAFAAPPPVMGRWLAEGGRAVVEVAPCGASLCGRIARVLRADPGAPAVDANNPDAALRRRPILGLPILAGFAPAGDRWKGQIYDPRSGRTYRSELTRERDTLLVRGCWGPFCKTQRWAKAG